MPACWDSWTISISLPWLCCGEHFQKQPGDIGAHILLQVNRTCAPLKTFTLHERRPLNIFKATQEAHKYLGTVSPNLDK